MIRGIFPALRRSWFGMIGLTVLSAILIMAAVSLIVFPSDYASAKWNNPAHWSDNPDVAPPIWTAFFNDSIIPHQTMELSDPEEVVTENGKVLTYRFDVAIDEVIDPTLLSFEMTGLTYYEGPPLVEVSFVHGEQESFINRYFVAGRDADAGSPVLRFETYGYRQLLTGDARAADRIDDALTTLRTNGESSLVATINVVLESPDDTVGSVTFVAGGNVYGLLGTDSIGRDIAQGILYGLPYALLIGFVVAIASTAFGAVVAGISGFFGGRTSNTIERGVDVWTTLPVLPLLIFLTFLMGASLRNVVIVLIAFSWTGLAIMLRPWIMQLRETGVVKLMRNGRGFSASRIIFLKLIPQTFPYLAVFFVMVIPSAILSEAGLSFLGLGDPSIPTWGQMLESASRTGAIYLNYWWWVWSPGIAIILTGIPFALIYLALESHFDRQLQQDKGGGEHG